VSFFCKHCQLYYCYVPTELILSVADHAGSDMRQYAEM